MKNIVVKISYLLIFFLVAVLSGCVTENSTVESEKALKGEESPDQIVHTSPNQLQTIRARGTLRVGVSVFVPWVMHSNKGELTGYEIDVAGKLASDMGVEVEFIQTSWTSIITGLLKDDFDIIISGLSLTPQRALLINFSEPYGQSSSVIVANKKLVNNKITRKQFNNKKTTIGTVKGSIGEQLLAQQFPKATSMLFESESHAIAALLSGKVYAMIASTPRTGYLLNQHKKELFQPFAEPVATYAEGFGIRKGDADILNFLNTWVKYNTGNGWLAERHHHWFDTIDWAGQL